MAEPWWKIEKIIKVHLRYILLTPIIYMAMPRLTQDMSCWQCYISSLMWKKMYGIVHYLLSIKTIKKYMLLFTKRTYILAFFPNQTYLNGRHIVFYKITAELFLVWKKKLQIIFKPFFKYEDLVTKSKIHTIPIRTKYVPR